MLEAEELSQSIWASYDVFVKHVGESLGRARALAKHLKHLSAASESHSEALLKLVPKKQTPLESLLGPPDESTELVALEVKRLGLGQRTLADDLMREASLPLKEIVKALEIRFDEVAKEGRTMRKNFEDAEKAMNIARREYYKACKATDDAVKNKEKAKATTRAMLLNKYQEKIRGDADQLESERMERRYTYETSVRQANDAQRKWFCVDMVASLRSLLEINTARATAVETAVEAVQAVVRRQPPSMLGYVGALKGINESGTRDPAPLRRYVADHMTTQNGPLAYSVVEPDALDNTNKVLQLRGVKRGSIVDANDQNTMALLYKEVTGDGLVVRGRDDTGTPRAVSLIRGQRVHVVPTRREANRMAGKSGMLEMLANINDGGAEEDTQVVEFSGIKGRLPLASLMHSPPDRRRVFGKTVEQVLECDAARFHGAPPADSTPLVARLLAHALFVHGAEQTEGIFRVPGDAKMIEELKVRLDSGADELAVTDPAVIGGMFKQWLREIKDGIFAEADYHRCIAATAIPAADEQAVAARALFEELSAPRRALCELVLAVLQRLCRHDEVVTVTRMNADNLAMVFAPALLRAPEPGAGADPMEAMAAAGKEKTFVKLLIENVELGESKSVTLLANPILVDIQEWDGVEDEPLEKPPAATGEGLGGGLTGSAANDASLESGFAAVALGKGQDDSGGNNNINSDDDLTALERPGAADIAMMAGRRHGLGRAGGRAGVDSAGYLSSLDGSWQSEALTTVAAAAEILPNTVGAGERARAPSPAVPARRGKSSSVGDGAHAAGTKGRSSVVLDAPPTKMFESNGGITNGGVESSDEEIGFADTAARVERGEEGREGAACAQSSMLSDDL